jgi:hypothetical protein
MNWGCEGLDKRLSVEAEIHNPEAKEKIIRSADREIGELFIKYLKTIEGNMSIARLITETRLEKRENYICEIYRAKIDISIPRLVTVLPTPLLKPKWHEKVLKKIKVLCRCMRRNVLEGGKGK